MGELNEEILQALQLLVNRINSGENIDDVVKRGTDFDRNNKMYYSLLEIPYDGNIYLVDIGITRKVINYVQLDI